MNQSLSGEQSWTGPDVCRTWDLKEEATGCRRGHRKGQAVETIKKIGREIRTACPEEKTKVENDRLEKIVKCPRPPKHIIFQDLG